MSRVPPHVLPDVDAEVALTEFNAVSRNPTLIMLRPLTVDAPNAPKVIRGNRPLPTISALAPTPPTALAAGG